MANQTFTVNLPDEPYSQATTSNESFDCEYTGPRYVMMQIDKDDFQVREGGRGDKADDRSIDPSFFERDEYNYVVVDSTASATHAMYCAYVTHEYTHADIADYEENLEDADGNEWTWTHQYEGTSGMLAHLHWSDSLLNDVVGVGWSGPVLRTHNNTRQSVLDGCKAQYQTIDAALLDTANQTMTDADRTTLVNHSAWLKVVEADVRYKDINHWKIPFPAEPLPYFELPD
jgi:hypothetical protein|tara:strand:- start:1324 stop:2013 length:690 start_codon:yes stop_codon:yes gene_type:complete